MTVKWRRDQVQNRMSMECLGRGMSTERNEEVEMNQRSDFGPPTPLQGVGFILR